MNGPSTPHPPLVRKSPVAWFAPQVLAQSAAEVVLSRVFANYADKREQQSGLSDQTYACDLESQNAFWLDYASDVGDGFDSTYFVARLLAEPELTVGGEGTRRGRVLVLGGDEVYPSASWRAYEERFKGPYRAALPDLPEDERPLLFAVPGNHDWYDGLTNFMRVFCQGSGVGGWRTQQRRSYFAIELPHKWWLWGIDTQFDAYIDAPQIEYFTKAAERAGDGHRIILATAKPSWVRATPGASPHQSWQTLAYFRERVLCKHGAELALTITGDLHHYARYVTGEGGEPKVTAGGGGACLSPTHWLPPRLELADLSGATTPYELASTWPTQDESKRLRTKILAHLNPARTFSLNWLLAALYGLLSVVLAAGVKDQAWDFTDALSGTFEKALLDAVTPSALLAAGLLGFLLWKWARFGNAPGLLGALHAGTHVAVIVVATLLVLERDPFDLADDGFWLGYVTALVLALLGAVLGRAILVAYLLVSQLLNDSWHANAVFAAQSADAGADYKHFVRFRLEPDRLTMFVIGARKTPRQWTDGDRPEPVGGMPDLLLVDRLEVPKVAAGSSRLGV